MSTGPAPHPPRPLRRRLDQAMVAGVAAGLAEYLEVDPVAVRLAFVVLALMGGIAVPLYVVAWLVVPVEGSPNSIAEDVFGQWV